MWALGLRHGMGWRGEALSFMFMRALSGVGLPPRCQEQANELAPTRKRPADGRHAIAALIVRLVRALLRARRGVRTFEETILQSGPMRLKGPKKSS
jgi:hypothetical protein